MDEVNTKIDAKIDRVDAKIDQVYSKINTKIAELKEVRNLV